MSTTNPVRDFWQTSSCSSRWGRRCPRVSSPTQHCTTFRSSCAFCMMRSHALSIAWNLFASCTARQPSLPPDYPQLENVAIANALQLEAARAPRQPVSALITIAPSPLPRQRFGMRCRRRSRRCHRWGHSSVHWKRNCSADHTAMQTIGHSSIDITAVV